MKKLFNYLLVCLFASLFIFGSCEEDAKKRAELRKKSRRYFTEYRIYEKIDSSYTNISVFVGEIDGHKYRYTLYSAKNKCQLIETHLTEECNKCKKDAGK